MDQVVIAQQRSTDEKFCSECGVKIKTKAEICPLCGVESVIE